MRQNTNTALHTAAFLVVILCSVASAQDSSAILGVLEDNPGHSAGDPHYRSVRVVFYKQREKWEAFPSNCPNQECLKSILAKYPKDMAWTVAFDGKILGSLESRAPKEFDFYSTVGQQTITSNAKVPTVGEPSESFAGFLGVPVYRPLIANSQPFYADPERWKRAESPADILSRVRHRFREKFRKVSNCANPETNVEQPWQYEDGNIKVLSSYSSVKGWWVVQVELDPYRCDGPSDVAFVDQWFVISPNSTVRFLGSAMWLVDAGDYDNDGRSEIVFSINDYNRGGYKLFYDDFSKSATFEFGYH